MLSALDFSFDGRDERGYDFVKRPNGNADVMTKRKEGRKEHERTKASLLWRPGKRPDNHRSMGDDPSGMPYIAPFDTLPGRMTSIDHHDVTSRTFAHLYGCIIDVISISLMSPMNSMTLLLL